MDQALVALNDKIDALTQQVAYLTEQAQRAERERQDRAELMHDMTPIVNDGFRMAVEQLEEEGLMGEDGILKKLVVGNRN